MNPKQIVIVGTMALAISLGSLLQSDETDALVRSGTQDRTGANVSVPDELHQALGVSSDEEIYDALYDGHSLADIAESNAGNVERIIDLQTAQLAEQLNARYASGSISYEQYKAYRAELAELVANSVYGRANGSG